MASTSETGHAKNVANFQDLISFVTGYGPTYNPNKDALKIPQLNTVHTNAQAGVADVISKKTNHDTAINDRSNAFKDLKSLATRIINALQVTDALPGTIEDAKAYNKKLQGARANASATPANPGAVAPNTRSTSQQSYDQQIQHLAGIISIVASEPSYAPNENDLKVATLTAKKADLTTKNNAVDTAYVSVSNARIARDKALYSSDTGLLDIATDVKQYVKSVFGGTSPQYDQVKSIKFSKKKD